jgi:hypothetical protein
MAATLIEAASDAAGRLWPEAAAQSNNNPINLCLDENCLGMFPPLMHVMHHRVLDP